MIRIKLTRLDGDRIRVELTISYLCLLSRVVGPLYETEPVILTVSDE
jgi:hypothetical protein